MLDWLREALTRRRIVAVGPDRRVRMAEEPPSERFVLSIALMVVFFVGLAVLAVVHMLLLGEWNETVFNGIMFVVGALVGALFGYREAPG